MVEKFLKEDPDERIPLIKVFQHPWVLYFKQKFFADWEPDSSSGEEESDLETGSDEGDDLEEEEEEEYDSEEDDEETPGNNKRTVGPDRDQHPLEEAKSTYMQPKTDRVHNPNTSTM